MAVLSRTVLLASLAIASGQHLPASNATYPRPYRIDVDPALIEQTLFKVKYFRPSVNIDEPAWEDGPPATNISSVRDYWLSEYDWFEVQREMNSQHPHYISTVTQTGSYNRSLDIHFIHERSNRSDATPLLMLHGWPSTSNDWIDVISPLSTPANSSDPAFHVIAPDIPGFGFSSSPTAPGLGAPQVAAALVELMAQLGYSKWTVYSTDLGFYVAMHMSALYHNKVALHASDFFLIYPNATDEERYANNQTSPEETAYIASLTAWQGNDSAYQQQQQTRPLALALAMSDSPLGFLGWMWQLVYAVSDNYAWSAKSLITRSLLLYLPGTYGNMRFYKETIAPEYAAKLPVTNVSTAVFQFGWTSAPYHGIGNVAFVPASWIGRYANVQYLFRTANGGHFPYESERELWLQQFRNATAHLL